jgi:hypothetical protein
MIISDLIDIPVIYTLISVIAALSISIIASIYYRPKR